MIQSLTLKKFLRANKIPQTAIAEALGKDQGHVSRKLNAPTIDFAFLEEIKAHFEDSIKIGSWDELMNETPKEDNQETINLLRENNRYKDIYIKTLEEKKQALEDRITVLEQLLEDNEISF